MSRPEEEKYFDTCNECGAGFTFTHIPPQHERAIVVTIEECPECGTLWKMLIREEGAYEPRRDTLDLQFGLLEILAEAFPATVRQVFYLATVRGLVEKTEAGYNKVQRNLSAMRRAGSIPYGWIADGTRWRQQPDSYNNLTDALDRMQRYYKRDLLAEQETYLEIWCEKDALSGTIYPVTAEYDVPLMVARGYSSITFVYEAAEAIKRIGKPTYIYHFGDFDADGVQAAESIREEFGRQGAQVIFQRVAVTEKQIQDLNLPTRPQKRTSTRAKEWGNKPNCELDAIPPETLRDMVRKVILQHIDPGILERTRRIEQAERETLQSYLKTFRS